jgi:hypothetical protein
MVSDRTPFVLTLVLTVLGLGAILYGVSLNYGESLNGPMVLGGIVVLLGVGSLTAWIISVDEAHAPESEGHA